MDNRAFDLRNASLSNDLLLHLVGLGESYLELLHFRFFHTKSGTVQLAGIPIDAETGICYLPLE
jgi:hypothetical protein